jgi:hypothetical protein
MGLLQKDIDVSPRRGSAGPYKAKSAKTAEEVTVTVDTDSQDDHEWDCAFAASQDVLSRLAAQSRKYREAGRTKRINS